jgi:galactokinase
MTANADRARTAFRAAFGSEPAFLVRAPGRVNLIGEHTDYNDGFVLPCAIDRDTVVAIGPQAASRLSAVAADFAGQTDQFSLASGFERSAHGWANYARGVAIALIDWGVPLVGAQLVIAGDVPLGSGLSSSASLAVAVARALTELCGSVPAPADLARIAQRAENDFVGCACGIMDQLIATSGQADHALLIDCRKFKCDPVPLPSDLRLIIAHSGIRHANTDGAYNERRAQCEAAAGHYGVAALRDLSFDELMAGRSGLNETMFRRARHVVTENERTLAAAMALRAGDLQTLGLLMRASHASMRDDFEITVPAIDQLAAIMGDAIGEDGGARMTGGGFGGCVIAVVRTARVESVMAAVAQHYRAPAGTPAEVFICQPSDGAGRVE